MNDQPRSDFTFWPLLLALLLLFPIHSFATGIGARVLTASFITAVLLSDAVPSLKPVWWSLAAVVSASRVHNRMHHGSDVVAGALIGTAMGVAVTRRWPLR